MKYLKQILVITLFFTLSTTSFAQVGIGTITPDPAAALHLESNSKGFLPPRMNKNQLDALNATAPEGLLIYCTDCYPKGIYMSDGTDFVALANDSGVTVDAVSLITTDTTPELNGTVGQTTTVVTVTVGGTEYTTTNNLNGTWTLADDTISPELSVDTHVITIKATKADGRSFTISASLVIQQ